MPALAKLFCPALAARPLNCQREGDLLWIPASYLESREDISKIGDSARCASHFSRLTRASPRCLPIVKDDGRR